MSDLNKGILLMIVTTMIFAGQDAISRYLAGEYNVWMVVAIRFWFLALFVSLWAMRKKGGLKRMLTPNAPLLQAGRGMLLVAEICVMVTAFTLLGLIESHAVFVCYPLLVAALSGPLLGENVGWRRWSAIGFGFLGVIIVLRPGAGVFSYYALIPLCAAFMFALYNVMTRKAASFDDSATAFFWTGIAGGALMLPFGILAWEPMTAYDWCWMAFLCLTGATAHFCLIKTYQFAEASAVQPFAYLQLVWASGLGLGIFGETLELPVVIGASVIIGAGLFTLWRTRQQTR